MSTSAGRRRVPTVLVCLALFLAGCAPGLRSGVWVSEGETEQIALEFRSATGLVTGEACQIRDGRKILEWGFAGSRNRADLLELQWGRDPIMLRATPDLRRGTIKGRMTFPDGTSRPATFVRKEPGSVAGFNALVEPYRLRTPAPDSGWEVATPADVGLDPERLEEFVRALARGEAGLIHSALLVRHGKLVLEEYFHGYDRHDLHHLQSCTKSVTSLLVGIALERGEIASLDDPVFDYFPEYAEMRTPEWDAVRLRHLLTMSAGLDWSVLEAYTVRGTGPRLFRRVLSRRVAHEPGTEFLYAGANVNLLAGVLRHATGLHADEFADRHLFGPLDFPEWNWEQGSMEGYPSLAGTLKIRPLEMAKLGQLVLNEGRWNGKQVVSPAWIRESTTGAIRIGPSGDEYAYLWWTLPASVGGRSQKIIVASGWGSQFIHIAPELDAVLVNTGGNNFNGKTFDLGRVMARHLEPAFGP